MQQERRDLLVFTVVVLSTTTLIVSSFPLLHITNNWAANALMVVPGVTAAVILLWRRESFRAVGWGAGPAIYWLLAVSLPIVAIFISLEISLRLGYVALAASSSKVGSLIGQPARLLKIMLMYTAVSIPFAFGEEFGWRGYAQGRLLRQFGLVRGLLLLGLIWGFWHSPIYYAMHTDPSHPYLGPFVMTPIDNLLAVVPMGWLYLRSRNIWVPTFTHAFADILWGFSGLLFPATREIASWAVLQIVQLVISAVLLWDWKSRPSETPILAYQEPTVSA